MSSGEVVFILAFIVLPTAILVSSVWAVIFVRRRPDPVVREPLEAEPVATVDRSPDQQETAVLATVKAPAGMPLVADDVNPEDQRDEEPELPAEPEPVAAKVETVQEENTAPVDEPEPAVEPLETPVLQSTEDLDEVVAAVRSHGDEESEDPVVQDEPEPEQEEVVAQEEPIHPDEPDEERFETSELPVVAEAPPVEQEEPDLPAQPEATRFGRQRRKQSVKLLPGDSDAPRHRGRNRETPRQVPQLSRAFRRRDESQPDVPPESDHDPDSTTARD